MSLPRQGFEIGSGFAGTTHGAEHNDESTWEGERVGLAQSSGGSAHHNGETIYFRVAFKPTATIMREQHTVDIHHEDTTIQGGAGMTRACSARPAHGRGDDRAGDRGSRPAPPGGT